MKRVFSIKNVAPFGHLVTVTPSFCMVPIQPDEDPLELSIQKWECVVENLPKYRVLDGGCKTCGLCQGYDDCDECPVEDCESSPYRDYYNARGDRDGMLEAAKAEVEFLKGLR